MISIALIGPESTGKTELSGQLAAYYHTVWEPELAREYIENLTREYTYDDVCEIARRQIEIEKKYEKKNNDDSPLFFDTDLIITKVWLEYKYKRIPEFLEKRLEQRYIDFYLLCEPDLEWEFDPVREHGGDDRIFFYNWYKKEIEKLKTPYAEISGIGENRLKNAVKAINEFIKNLNLWSGVER